MLYTNKINSIQKEIHSLYKVPYSKSKKQILKKQIKIINSEFSELTNYASKISYKLDGISNVVNKGLIVITVVAQGAEEYINAKQVNMLYESYTDMFSELSCCGDDNIEYVAQQAKEDVLNMFSQDFVIDATTDIAAVAQDLYLAGKGVAGFSAALVLFAANISIGNSLGVELNNSISVQFSIILDMITNKQLVNIRYTSGNNDNIYIISNNNCNHIKEYWGFDIFGKNYSEKKYLTYLDTERVFVDDDCFLYKSSNPKENAINNVEKLRGLFEYYILTHSA